MPETITVKKSTLAVLLLLFLVIGIIVWQVYYAAPPTPPTAKYKYTTGLTVKFKVYNAAVFSLVTNTEAPTIEFFAAGTNPFTRTFTTKPVATASYDATNNYWTVPLDAGTYVVLIRDNRLSPKFYPEKYIVTVSGTNNEDREVWLNPSQLNVYDRADVTDSIAIKGYSASGWEDVLDIDCTAEYDKFLVTYTLLIGDGGTSKIVKAGRLYIDKITGLVPTSASLDGTVVAVVDDVDATDDGLTGYYIEFNDMTAGEIHRFDITFELTGVVSATSLNLRVFEYYDCLRTALRWWTAVSETVTVVPNAP